MGYAPTNSSLLDLDNQWNPKKKECRAIIETPKGRRNKFSYDPESRLFELGGLLPEGMSFPFDFGFVPCTLAQDGDPVDIMVLMDEPAHVGCALMVRLVGAIEADQTEDGKTETNDRLLGVSVHSYSHEHVKSIKEVQKSILDQIEAFFVNYNRSRGKKFKVRERCGPERAARILEETHKRYAGKRGGKSA